MIALNVIVASTTSDEEVREEAAALRAGLSIMNEVSSYDYCDDIGNLVTYWQDPQNAAFDVEELTSVDGQPARAAVVLDATDPLRIGVVVTVTWTGRRGARSFRLPMTLTELER